MTVSPFGPPLIPSAVPVVGAPRRTHADGATLGIVFALSLLIIPARLVLKGIPLSLTPANILSLVAGLAWMCATFTTTLGAAKGRTPVRTALFVYAMAHMATFGVANAGYLPADESKLADHALVLVIANVGIALAVADGVRTAERLDYLLKALVVGGAVIGVIGALQFIFAFDLTLYMQKAPLFRFASEGGAVDDRESLRRVASTAAHPIEFGVVCAMLLPLAAHFGFQAKARAEPAVRWWICVLLIGMGLLFSVSRSAVVGLAIVSLVLFVGWPGRRRWQALAAALGCMVLTKLFVPGLLGALYRLFANFGSDYSIKYRTHRYELAWVEIVKHPWLGRGTGTWYVPKYVPFDNQWIMTAVEGGFVGALAFGAIFLTAAYSALRGRYLNTDPDARDLGLALLAGVSVPPLVSATFDLLSFGMMSGLTFLLVGATAAYLRVTTETVTFRRPAEDQGTGTGTGPDARPDTGSDAGPTAGPEPVSSGSAAVRPSR